MTHHTGHRNDMTTWTEITCQRGHLDHATTTVTVDLARRHRYADLAQIPAELVPRPYQLVIFDPVIHPVDGGPYCPAHDAVSATIRSHHVWEPRETALVLRVCATSDPDKVVVDFGSQVGWYTALAAQSGLAVEAWDADPENQRLLAQSRTLNPQWRSVEQFTARITTDSTRDDWHPIRLVKIDLEGAEADALRLVQFELSEGNVDHLLVEVSPVFHDGYPDLVRELIGYGFRAYMLPPKQRPPVEMHDPEAALHRIDDHPDIASLVASWHQEDVWFRREDATW